MAWWWWHGVQTELEVLGCAHVSDLYPNVKYKLSLLQQDGLARRCRVYDLGAGSLWRSYRRSLPARLASLLRLAWGNCVVFAGALCDRPGKVYVLYPALPIALLYSLLPAARRPRLYLDAFISLYDTAVNDRQLLAPNGWRARLLFALERRAFRIADKVVVDTGENARFYAALFGLPEDRFAVVPLSVPVLGPLPATGTRSGFDCLFVGSLVPLQGIRVILDACRLLQDQRGIRFILVGDGQQAPLVESYLREHPGARLRWHRGLLPTGALESAINAADLCLGIFGDSGKAQRVLPYKIYYYAALGKPFLTLDTAALREFCGPRGDLFLVPQSTDGRALADRILALARNPQRLPEMAATAALLHREKLSVDTVRARLLESLGAG